MFKRVPCKFLLLVLFFIVALVEANRLHLFSYQVVDYLINKREFLLLEITIG